VPIVGTRLRLNLRKKMGIFWDFCRTIALLRQGET
jgi:hypothetical protein